MCVKWILATKGRWYYQLHKRQTQLPRIFTISNPKVGWLYFRRTNQRGRQGCWPMKLKLSAKDSVKLNFSQLELKLLRQDLAQLTDQARTNLAFQIWIESENSWQLCLAFMQLVISFPFNSKMISPLCAMHQWQRQKLNLSSRKHHFQGRKLLWMLSITRLDQQKVKFRSLLSRFHW